MRVLTGLLVFLMIAGAAGAQTFRGGINGIVTDQTGAILPGADVKATNEATGLSYSTISSTAGAFTFADLPLGDYTIVVSESGFETITIRGVRVSAGAIYTVSVRLNVAQIEANVQVSAAAVAVETTSTTLTNVLSTRTVQDLPLNGRDFSQMLALTPGFSGYEGGGAASMNGSRSNQFNWQIEGTDNNDQWFNIKAVNQGGINSIPGVLLPLDSVEEYSVQTQASAETGRNPGGAVNLIIKSGTNQPRGSAYYYNRNEALAALSPFAPTDSPKNKLRNEHYGFSLGGPIERDKTFFFTTYEHQNFVIGNQALATMPSAAYQAAAMQLLQQYSVPVNSVSLTLLNTLWPADTLTGAASSNNYFNPTPQTGYSHNFLVKVDHSLNNDHRLSFRAFFGRGSQTAPVGSLISDYFQVGPMRVQNYSAVHNAVLGSSLTNQLLVGVNYFNQTFSDANSSFDPVRLGFNTGVSGSDLAGAPFLSITGFDPTGVSPNSGRTDVITHVSDALSYTKGKHEMRFGGEIRRVGIEEFGAGGGNNDGGRGNFFFNGTQGPWGGLLSVTGYDTNIAALADFLAGYVYQSTILSGDVRRHVDQNLANLFAQDSWRLNRQLNINLGLRWDFEGPMHDGRQDLSTFDPNRGGLVVVGRDIEDLYPRSWKNFSPRLGFTYQPNGRDDLVVRGGLGLFYDTPSMSPFLDQASLANNGAIGVEANPAGSKPVYQITRNGYTIAPSQAIFPANISLSGNNVINLFSVSPDFRPAYVTSYNVNVEKTLGRNAIVQIGYVGSKGRRLNIVRDINQAAMGSGFVRGTNAAGFTFQQQTRPYFAQFPNFGVIDQLESVGISSYNSLQATLRTRNWHGVISQLSYTLAHNRDEASNATSLPQDSNNLMGDYSNAASDIRHHVGGYLLYDVPGSSHGPAWLSHGWQLNTNISVRTGFPFTVRASSDTSGTGENTTRANQVADPFDGVSHAVTSGQSVTWINRTSFVNPASGNYGAIARNSLYGPGYASVDLSVFKAIPLRDQVRAQLRLEMFNIFNRVNLAQPGSRVGGGLGRVGDTIGDSRGSPGIGPGEPFNMQLAVKLLF
ncbi:MAG: TonB-dependent receptor [Acidobacteria bacterium]|nr:MAG: TonB-dependent receptor [Acidobacteriota bacterium]